MIQLFIPHRESIELQKLGFNKPCLAWYNYDKLHIFGYDNLLDSYAGEDNRPLAPLYQQVFKWARDVHNIDCYIERDGKNYNAIIKNTLVSNTDTYENAELESVLEIINIVKKKK